MRGGGCGCGWGCFIFGGENLGSEFRVVSRTRPPESSHYLRVSRGPQGRFENIEKPHMGPN